MRHALLAGVFAAALPSLAHAGGGLTTPRIGGLGPNGPTEADVPAVYWNAAAIVLFPEKLRVSLDVTYTSARGEINRTVLDGGVLLEPGEEDQGARTGLAVDLPVPFFGAVYKITPKLAAGFAFMAPIGRAVDYIEDRGALTPAEQSAAELAAPTRYQTTRSLLQSLYLTPTVAYAITPKLSVGAGLDVIFSMFAADSAVDLNGNEDPQNQAFVHVGAVIADGVDENGQFTDEDGDGVALIDQKPLTGLGFGANLGIHYQASDRIALGLGFLSRSRVTAKGTAVAEATVLGTAFAPTQQGDATVSYNLPDTLNVGVRVGATPRLDVDLWAQYSTYALHDKLEIDLVNFNGTNGGFINREPDAAAGTPGTALARQFQNNVAVNLGANYKIPAKKARVGAAVMFESSAIPTEAATAGAIDGNKLDIISYVEFRPAERLRLLLGYSLIVGLGATNNTGAGNSIFQGSRSDEGGGDCAGNGNDPVTGLCYPAGNGVYSATIGRVGLTLGYAF
jgi:long-chain fatty acid transport protein